MATSASIRDRGERPEGSFRILGEVPGPILGPNPARLTAPGSAKGPG